MYGYIFEYFQYIRYTKDSLRGIENVMDYPAAEKTFVTFGDFDRLKVNKITDISRFRDLSELAKKWIGNKQSLIFYTLDDEPSFSYKEDNENIGFWNNSENVYDEHLFFAVTEFPFLSMSREKKEDYEGFIARTKSELSDAIDKQLGKNCSLSYMIMGNLGTFGISVIWFADQFTDVLNIVNTIKMTKKGSFLSAHTIFSKNPCADKNKISNIKGKCLVQFTLKNGLPEDMKYPKSVKVYDVMHTCGQYDIVLQMKANKAYSLFEDNDKLNHDKDVYQKEILQTKVTLCKDMLPGKHYTTNTQCNTEGITDAWSKKLKEIQDLSNEIREILKKEVNKSAGIVDTFDTLVCDYRYNVLSAVNEIWREDFSHMFNSNLQCIKEMLDFYKSTSTYDSEMLDTLRTLMNNLKQQIFHITEANSLNFEIPKSHLRYTGQEDSILFCYMGIIKEIIRTAYQLESRNFQSEIVPIVTVDTVPIIKSDLYFDKTLLYENDFSQPDQKVKILAVNLPHVSFYDISTYMTYLYHEVYHYIVPRDREKRDVLLGMYLSSIYYKYVLKDFLKVVLKQDILGDILDYLLPALNNIIVKNYEREIHAKLIAQNNATNKDCVFFISNVYANHLQNFLKQDLKDWMNQECSFFSIIVQELNEHMENSDSVFSYQNMASDLDIDKSIVQQIKQLLKEQDTNNRKSIVTDCEQLNILIQEILNGIKEVYADIPMIEFCNMSLDEYIIYYINCQKNLLRNPDALSFKNEKKELVRLTMVYEYFQRKGESWDKTVYKRLQEIFWAQNIKIHENDKDINIRNKFLLLSNELERWIKKIYLEVENKKEDVLFWHHNIVYDILEDASIIDRACGYNFHATCNICFTPNKVALQEYGRMLRRLQKEKCGMNIGEIWRKYEKQVKKFEETIFKNNIKLINLFQKETTLESLSEQNEKHNNTKRNRWSNNNIEKNKFGFSNCLVLSKLSDRTYPDSGKAIEIQGARAYNVSDLINNMEKFTSKLNIDQALVLGEKNYPLWYRGQENASYGLLPTNMRVTDARKEEFQYLAQYQRHLFEEFKYRADGAPEILGGARFSYSDYLALMQHYEMHTNLLDWSEDAFTGIFFALEKLIMKERATAEADASMCIFSPYLYNCAREQMISESSKCLIGLIDKDSALEASIRTLNKSIGKIPNISTIYNEDFFDVFILGNSKYEDSERYGYREKIKLSGTREIAFLPIAVNTSRLNPRMRSQSGMFLAYNLYTEPSIDEGYSYMELEKIQSYYLNECRAADRKQFLYKIIIERSAASSIANAFRALGLSKERVYPELANVGKRIL